MSGNQFLSRSYCWLTLWVLHYHLSMHLQTIKCGVTIASPRCSHMLHISLPVWVYQHVAPLHTPDITNGRYFAVSIIVNPGRQAWSIYIASQDSTVVLPGWATIAKSVMVCFCWGLSLRLGCPLNSAWLWFCEPKPVNRLFIKFQLIYIKFWTLWCQKWRLRLLLRNFINISVNLLTVSYLVPVNRSW